MSRSPPLTSTKSSGELYKRGIYSRAGTLSLARSPQSIFQRRKFTYLWREGISVTSSPLPLAGQMDFQRTVEDYFGETTQGKIYDENETMWQNNLRPTESQILTHL